MNQQILKTNSFEQTQKAGEKFSQQLQCGDVVLLYGDLGAGKTTFMQGVAKGLGIQRRITSPTFNIVRRYEVPSSPSSEQSESRSSLTRHPELDSGSQPTGSPVGARDDKREIAASQVFDHEAQTESAPRNDVRFLYHIDLYRTESKRDLLVLGLHEILEEKDAIVAIEWPEKLGDLMPHTYWKIELRTVSEKEREITIQRFGTIR